MSVQANSTAPAVPGPAAAGARQGHAREFWQRFARNRAALGGLVVLLVIVVVALVGPLFFKQGPFELAGPPFSPPFGQFPLGTDMLGRNELAGIVFGARTSLLIGLVATLFATLLGGLLGGIAGYYGGAVDEMLMRLTEMFQTIPSFLFAILVVAILSPSRERRWFRQVWSVKATWPRILQLMLRMSRDQNVKAAWPRIRP